MRNRILRIKDAADNESGRSTRSGSRSSESAGFTQENLNGSECGGFWMDKYQSCMHDASNVSRGSVSATSPGLNGAASMPGVVIWDATSTGQRQDFAIENREGVANKAQALHGVWDQPDEVLCGGRHAPARRRVRSAGRGNVYPGVWCGPAATPTLTQNAAKPSNSIRRSRPITGNDTYEIVRHFLPGGI